MRCSCPNFRHYDQFLTAAAGRYRRLTALMMPPIEVNGSFLDKIKKCIQAPSPRTADGLRLLQRPEALIGLRGFDQSKVEAIHAP